LEVATADSVQEVLNEGQLIYKAVGVDVMWQMGQLFLGHSSLQVELLVDSQGSMLSISSVTE
jgi:hypothetical protein